MELNNNNTIGDSMRIEDNKIVIKKTIELMKQYNISKEYQKISTVKTLIKIMDKAVEKVKNKKQESKIKDMNIAFKIFRLNTKIFKKESPDVNQDLKFILSLFRLLY